MTDRIHIAYCDQCGDEICEGDAHRVVVLEPAEDSGLAIKSREISSDDLRGSAQIDPVTHTKLTPVGGEPTTLRHAEMALYDVADRADLEALRGPGGDP